MAETLISPGVLARENDNSFITQQPVTVGAALIGPTVKGPVEIPTLCTTYSSYLNKFGSIFLSGGQEYSYFTSIAAYNYFQQGGQSLLVTRVVSGSFSEATVTGGAISGSNTSGSFTLKTISEGTIMNNSGSLGTNGILSSGSSDNVRWQITGVDTGSGQFSLLIRQGDDTTTEPIVLETWANLSLDPTQDNYIARVIGDSRKTLVTDGDGVSYIQEVGNYPNSSNYVYVSAVQQPTPNYFNNNGTAQNAFTGSIPTAASGTFTGATGNLFYGGGAAYYSQSGVTATNIQGIRGDDYDSAISLMANQDDYRFNVISVPGLTMDVN